jgi:hypothetical protein
VFTFSGVLIFMACCYAFIKYIFWEPSGVERGSLIYQLKIPKVVKNYPTWGELGTPLYDLRIADGEKPRMVKVYYTSASDFPSLISQVKKLNFNCTGPAEKHVLCFKNGEHSERYEISFRKTKAGTEVTVYIIGEY